MNDAFVMTVLEQFTPAAGCVELDWQDVLNRARVSETHPRTGGADSNGTGVLPAGFRAPAGRVRRGLRSRKRVATMLAIIAAAGLIAAVTPAGSAIARSFDNFTGWLSGEPGKPASPTQQQAFERAIRSWSGFPAGTQLRRLVQTHAGGATFTLYGFRGAGSLCLRLVVTGAESAHELACPPLSALQSSSEPALVVVAGFGVGVSSKPAPPAPLAILRIRPPAALVTLGIVADGVHQIGLADSDGITAQAVVNGDAFLSVDSDPSLGERTTQIWAISNAKHVAVPFVSSPVPSVWSPSWPQTVGPRLSAHGPSSVQRVVHGGEIAWLAHRQPVGIPVPKTVHHIVGVLKSVIFAREIAPDPSAPERLVVSVHPAGTSFGNRLRNGKVVCIDVVGGRYQAGGGCWLADRLFSTAPFSFGVGENRGSQYVTIAGLASDDVARLALYLGTGQKVAVPIHDNGYIVEAASSDYPLRLVAYDQHRLVIGIATLNGGLRPPMRLPPRATPVANAHWHSIIHNSAGQVFVAPSTNGGTCYAIGYSNRSEDLECPPPLAPDQVDYRGSWDRRGARVLVTSGSAIARVLIQYRDGHTQTLTPTDGIAITIPPQTAQTTQPILGSVVSVTGLDASRHAFETPSAVSPIGGSGTIARLTTSSISIGPSPAAAAKLRTHGTIPHFGVCRVASSSPPLNGYRVGDHVQYLCQGEVLTLIGRATPNPTWPERTIWAKGPVTTITASSISIRNTLAGPAGGPAPIRTCSLNGESPPVRRYHTGEQVQIFCARGLLTGINRARLAG